MKLASPDHYRTYEGCGSGIPDEMEAKYQEGIRSFFTRYGTLDADNVASVSGNVTYVVPDFWMFCTSMEPTSTSERESLCRGFEADCVTRINDPSKFAQELGTAFAAGTSRSSVGLNVWDEFVRQLRPPEIGDRVVWMYHGPVLYCAAAEQLVESFPVIVID